MAVYIVQVPRACTLPALALTFPLMAAATGYVDSKLCAGCHKAIAETYAQTGMGRSFSRPSAAAIPDPPREFVHDRSDTRYAMVQRDGAWYQRRWQPGFGGKESNVEELRIDYIMGSGNHARTFLHRTPRGTLLELPFGWYAEGKGRWGMSPGSDSERPWTRRFISYKCMFCHNGVPQIPAANEAPGADPVYVGDLPEGIDCQRCHGPGARHLQVVANGKSTAADVRASIVNPARLQPARAMEICMSCHLETTSGRIPSRIVRFDRGPFSYLPGEPLDRFMLTFDHAPGTGHDDKFEAVSSVYRLRQSKCFTASAGKLTCTTCHDPHKAARGAEAVAQYSKKCAECHTPHVATNDCIGCHMPKRRAEDTPGMVMTDHLIQRRRPSRDLVAEFRERPLEEYRGPVVPYYPAKVEALYESVAQVGLKNNLEAGLPVLAREVAARKPKEAEFYHVLADAWRAAGNERAAAAVPNGTRPAHVDLANADAAAIARAIQLDAMLPDQHRFLGDALLRAGKRVEALDALREALRTDPGDDAAWDLAGRALAEGRQWDEAFYYFDRALRLRPGHAPYLYDYGLALARADRLDEARKRAEAAGALPRARLLLGNILIAQGNRDAAIPHLRDAAKSGDAAVARSAADALRRIGAR
jgi:tetratricopeptide (TPR) repeat protein